MTYEPTKNADEFRIGKIQIIEITVGGVLAILAFIAVVIIFAAIVKLCRRVCKKCNEGDLYNKTNLYYIEVIITDNVDDIYRFLVPSILYISYGLSSNEISLSYWPVSCLLSSDLNSSLEDTNLFTVMTMMKFSLRVDL